jgi:hypothetical protein
MTFWGMSTINIKMVLNVISYKFNRNSAAKKMLKPIIRSASLMALAVIGLSSAAPAFASGDTCEGSCGRVRACQYNGKELTLTEPTQLTPTPDPPVQLVDPPAFDTPQSVPQVPQQPIRRPRFPTGRG